MKEETRANGVSEGESPPSPWSWCLCEAMKRVAIMKFVRQNRTVGVNQAAMDSHIELIIIIMLCWRNVRDAGR
ncbi:hypothetical protein HanIR_Chr06g0279921 [Helianthus annuus]|nr:hypothetical protein HanIR_Chr06g0279921 [Helianthus annuus]